jgi:hypothetical protein
MALWLYSQRDVSYEALSSLIYLIFLFYTNCHCSLFLCLLFSKISGDLCNSLYYLIFHFYALICFLSLLAYGRHFDRLISSPLYLMNRGFRKRGFYRVIKFNRVLKIMRFLKLQIFTMKSIYLQSKKKS